MRVNTHFRICNIVVGVYTHVVGIYTLGYALLWCGYYHTLHEMLFRGRSIDTLYDMFYFYKMYYCSGVVYNTYTLVYVLLWWGYTHTLEYVSLWWEYTCTLDYLY